MDNKDNNKNIVTKIFAWIGLAIIAALIFVIVYAMITRNGMLALAGTISLIFISIVYGLGILAYKRITKVKELEKEVREKEQIIDLANKKTKNI